jgi:hypothetical protein
VKRLGIPDSQIILMLADDVACNPRNPFAGTVYSNADRKTDLYGEQIEVDYKGEEVNVENFLRLLSGELILSLGSGSVLLYLNSSLYGRTIYLLHRSLTGFDTCFETTHD